MEAERTNCLNNILQSDSSKKVIVAGPGTGKTYTFQRLLELDPTNNLVITFINNLVKDMQETIGHLAEIRTFHSLSLKELHSKPYYGITSDFHFYPSLVEIVSIDSLLISAAGFIETSFDKRIIEDSFRLLNEHEPAVDFFLTRANYYDSVGFDDSVYRVLKRFENKPETIPIYGNVFVDEYQDFNQLEVEFINHLEVDGDILIVGDDDQAVYQFRGATPNHLREKARDPDYELFPLPYCSRCTDIVIKSIYSIIENAQKVGLLTGRVQKEFTCYMPNKEHDNESYPLIKKAFCSVNTKKSPYISKYIESQLSSIDAEEIQNSIEGQYPLALIVGPSHYLDQIYEYLSIKFPNVEYHPREDYSINILDGYKFLIKDEKSNLGWRIVLDCTQEDGMEQYVIEAYKTDSPIYEVLNNQFIEHHLTLVSYLIIAIENPDRLSQEIIDNIESLLSMSMDTVLDFLKLSAEGQDTEDQNQSHDVNDIPRILLTTYNGCKGLSSGFTFVTGLEEDVFPRENDNPTLSDVCQLIVSMTRTRKECHLIHSKMFAGKWKEKSIFIDWIPDDFCQIIEVNKTYF
ncbi:MAG: UvrD-helicase domain-containing protein [Candidatus Heimdallarchaeota archaeon]